MSRSAFRRLFLAFTAVQLSACYGEPPRSISIRPVDVRVVDAVSGAPLAGMSVVRVLETEKYTGVQVLEPTGTRSVSSEFTTDATGQVRLPALRLELERREYLRHEDVHVNMGGRATSLDWSHSECTVHATEWTPDEGQRASPGENPDCGWRYGSLLKPSEEWVIRLQPSRADAEPHPAAGLPAP
ncbi:MAG TPA: hypothetical protein VD838_05035 [Anaeromyxobacteraceae bacterium]|nr:hypothetical protein [Anaeromyxobacteraceae bacterium]